MRDKEKNLRFNTENIQDYLTWENLCYEAPNLNKNVKKTIYAIWRSLEHSSEIENVFWNQCARGGYSFRFKILGSKSYHYYLNKGGRIEFLGNS